MNEAHKTALVHEVELEEFTSFTLAKRSDVTYIKVTPTDDNPHEYICAGLTDELDVVDIQPDFAEYRKIIPF